MQSAHLTGREKVKSYSTEFLSELPIKYLLQQAQKNQQSYAGKIMKEKAKMLMLMNFVEYN